jgi:Zn-dependent protease
LNCEFCGKEEALPFVCNYCGGAFCAEHRLPEAHQCKGDLTQRRMVTAPPQTSYSWTGMPTELPQRQPGRPFSGVEIRDIIIAWTGLGLAFFFAIVGATNVLAGSGGRQICGAVARVCLSQTQVFLVALATVGSGFVLHELSHKFTAQRYGYWAEFRMWPFGLILALVTSLIGFIFAAPGATYISGQNITESENGKISLAGPLTNVGVATIFLPIYLFGSGSLFWGFLGSEGVFINVFLALFNLLPIMPLDGAKVFRWNKPVWLGVFVPLAVVFAFSIGVL